MAYRIDYGSPAPRQEVSSGNLSRVAVLTCLFVAAFLILTAAFWPEGREVLRMLLIPGDPDTTLEAAEVFARELHQGFSLRTAAADFCRTVLNP